MGTGIQEILKIQDTGAVWIRQLYNYVCIWVGVIYP